MTIIKLLKKLFSKPCVIGIIANTHEGKSNMIYYFLEELRKRHEFKLYTYGLRVEIKDAQEIFSVEELESIKDSIIFLDEFNSMIEIENRKEKRAVENTIRLIFHNNNILVLAGLPENYKKFLSAKLHRVIFKKVTYDDLINGSKVKKIITNYCGNEKGSAILNLGKDEALVFDGKSYEKIKIPYLRKFDSKKGNVKIVRKLEKKVEKKRGVSSKGVENESS